MNDPDRATACRLLRRLREQRGWSWADQARALQAVAERLGVTAVTSTRPASLQRSIARWESTAARTVPGERYQLLLAHLYAHTGCGEPALGAGSDLDALLTALAHLGVPARRTQDLRDLVMRSISVDSDQFLVLLADPTRRLVVETLRDRRRLNIDVIRRLRSAVSDVDRQIGSVPFVRLQLLLAPVVEVCRRLPETEPLRECLGMLRSHAYLLAGRCAFETRDDAIARRWYTRAVEAAGAVTDTTRRAAVRTSYAMTMLHSTGDDMARTIIDAAVADAKHGSDHRVRARAHALEAEEAARSGRDRDAAAALRLAWFDVESAGSADGAFDADRLRGFERSATTLLHDCVETIAVTGGRVAAQRIRRARRELAPWRTESFVAELDDHIYDALLAN